MILLDKPYVSEFLKRLILENNISVVDTENICEFDLPENISKLTEKEVIEKFVSHPETKIYTNSENAITWIDRILSFTDLPKKINLFKDKYLFRQLTKNLYPNLFFKQVKVHEFDQLEIESIPKPFIIKPSVGFFSMAVYKVEKDSEWNEVKRKIRQELKEVSSIYPKEVMDSERFIIEEVIEGAEFACDAYYNDKGNPVVLNIMKHAFSSEESFSDRLYITSPEIIQEWKGEMESFLIEVGKLTGLRNFPLHVELRSSDSGNLVPIEVNPLRFGGWCTTADAAWFFYKSNSIMHFFNETQPDWNKIYKDKKDEIGAMFVLENSTGYKAEEIESFDYKLLLSKFKNPVELRKIDYTKYPVFGFLFVNSSSDDYSELEELLNSDLKEYIKLK